MFQPYGLSVNYQPAQITGTRAVSTHRYLDKSAIPALAFFAPRDAESVRPRPPPYSSELARRNGHEPKFAWEQGGVYERRWSRWRPGLRHAEPGKDTSHEL